VIKELVVPGSTDTIVLAYPDPAGSLLEPSRNIIRRDEQGKILWDVEPLPEAEDCFVKVWWEGEFLLANSWSGYLVTIDPETGIWLDSVFVK
jgi:hypothetical protein